MKLNSLSLSTYGLNLFIRGLTIGAKFFFTVFLGREYPSEVLGEYGLFSTTVLLCFFVLSFSFESYGYREIILKPKEEQASAVRDLFIFFLLSFLLFAPICAFFFADFVALDLIPYFIILLLLETLSQVLFGLFTILQRQVSGNAILFFSQGLWILVSFVIWYVHPPWLSSLKGYLIVWIFGSSLAVIFGYLKLSLLYKHAPVTKIDWAWIKRGLSVSLLFFGSALSYKFIEFTSRYLIELKLGTTRLGIFVFFSQISNLINTIINVMVIIMLYPRLVETYYKNDLQSFVIIKNKMFSRVIWIGLLMSLGQVVFIQLVLKFLGKESFEQELTTFYILLLGNIFINLSFIPHYCLYALKKDFILLATTFLGSVLNFVLNVLLIDQFGLLGAAIATAISFLAVWLSKSFYFNRHFTLPQV